MPKQTSLANTTLNCSSIGKNSDRVNLNYFRRVLIHYSFPDIIIDSIYNLIIFDINGFFLILLLKIRGLKQGDPISCILYNFALEPLFRTLLSDSAFLGYSFIQKHLDLAVASDLPPIELLSYADDILLFLNNAQDFSIA